jgi:predicted metalloprotease with PDZ domain
MTLAYQVSINPTRAHTFDVQLVIPNPAASQQLRLPAWIPGSYLVREFAKQLGPVQAQQGRKTLAVRQLEKASWQVICKTDQPLCLRYSVYAHDASVRTAWLEASRGFFNPTSLCLQVVDQEHLPHVLTLLGPKQNNTWQVATGALPLKANKAGWGSYQFDNYDALADSPFEMGPLWKGHFKTNGVEHLFAVAHAAPTFDGERLLADTQKIVARQIAFWNGKKAAPHQRYAFLLAAVDDGYGGLEHQFSTALMCKRADLPRQGVAKPHEGYLDLLGLISHEYFHTWNVKRMRPTEFTRYDYTQENYTSLLWFFEGFTSYYDDVLLVRAGLLSPDDYLKRLTKTLTQVAATPGRKVQSVAQASFDAWVKYYRPDENSANCTVSYYTKGSLVALCLDLTLRREGKGDLDQVMRLLWRRSQGGPIDEAAIADALQHIGGRSYAAELAAWVHGVGELPVHALLEAHGVTVAQEVALPEQALGMKVQEGHAVMVKQVLAGGAAEQAGFAPGDEWLGVEIGAGAKASAWRLHKLGDLALYAGKAKRIKALVARDKRLLHLTLALPAVAKSSRLTLAAPGLVKAWLTPPH